MHGHDLRGLHIKEVSQHTVTQVRCSNCQIGHCAIKTAHLEGTASFERKGSWSNEVFNGQSRIDQPLPVKIELIVVSHVEHGVHQMQSFLTVERVSCNTKATEVIE